MTHIKLHTTITNTMYIVNETNFVDIATRKGEQLTK